MKIEYLHILNYKNLDNLEIHFSKGSFVNALIGANGSGKSNVIEAITIIFASLKTAQEISFSYKIKYSIGDKKYEITNMESGTVAQCDGKRLSKSELATALPSTLFLYYCGETTRLKTLATEFVDKDFEKSLKRELEPVFKYLTYTTVKDFGAALLSNLAFKHDSCKTIFDIVHIEAIHLPITFCFKRPNWSSKSGKADNFWNSIGAVRLEIEKLLYVSGTNKPDVYDDSVQIVVNDLQHFHNKWFSAFDLFKSLKMLMQADILDSIEFDICKKDNDFIFSYQELSEGEKQLGQLLSLIDITKEHRALFLMDEFDAYLHPGWQRKFIELITYKKIEGQILLTTHSPLTLGKMKKENILILKNGIAYNPAADTLNRDITEVLEEAMDIGTRPQEVEEAIKDFRNAAMNGNKSEVKTAYEVLTKIISKDDPFFITANQLLARLDRGIPNAPYNKTK